MNSTRYESDDIVSDDEHIAALPATTYQSSPTDNHASASDNTPKAASRGQSDSLSPKLKIHDWTSKRCARFIRDLGPDYAKYIKAFLEEGVNGKALIVIQHEELKELGIMSMGHRLTILKAVYNIKLKQKVPFDSDHYIPLSSMKPPTPQPTVEDIQSIVHQVKLRDNSIRAVQAQLKDLSERVDKVWDEVRRGWDDTRRLREDMLPVVRAVKESSQPLPAKPPQIVTSAVHVPDPIPSPKGPPPMPPMIDIRQPAEGLSRSLSRKLSNKRFPFTSSAKVPSPVTIREAPVLESPPSTVTSHLTPVQAPSTISQQPSPTSPPYAMVIPTPSSRLTQPTRETIPRDDSWAATYSQASAAPSRLETRSAVPSSNTPSSRRAPYATPSSATLVSVNSSLATTLGRPSNGPPSSALSEDLSNPIVSDRFKVDNQQTTDQVLLHSLHKWHINGDIRHYSLYIVYGDRERLLTPQEKPLALFKEFQRQGLNPMFMLRKKADGTGVGPGAEIVGMGVGDGAQYQLGPSWGSRLPGGEI